MTDESGAVGLVLARPARRYRPPPGAALAGRALSVFSPRVELLRRRGAEVAGGDPHGAAVSSGAAPVRAVLLASRACGRPREQGGNMREGSAGNRTEQGHRAPRNGPVGLPR